MDKKSVMGHNPLEHNHLADAKFDFIPYTEGGSDQEESAEKEKKINKKTVSYYLEEDLIRDVKRAATREKMTFSSFVGHVLKRALRKK